MGKSPVSKVAICHVSTADICPVSAADMCPVSTEDSALSQQETSVLSQLLRSSSRRRFFQTPSTNLTFQRRKEFDQAISRAELRMDAANE